MKPGSYLNPLQEHLISRLILSMTLVSLLLIALTTFIATRSSPQTAFLMAALAAMVLLIVAVVLGQGLWRKFSLLTHTAQRFGAGDLSARVEIESNDELGLLAAAFNQMADQLQKSFEELRQREERIQQQNEKLIESNRELNIARQQAEEVTRLKSEFMATMSHELRTPLNAIIGYTEIQLAGITGPLNPKQQAHQERVLANAEHLLNLINEILDLAKVEAGRLQMSQEPFTVKTWLGEVVQQVQALSDEKGLRLETIIDPHLPDILFGDVGRLKQIVINLLSNAIKFTDVGLVEVKVSRKDAETWTIKVTDTGVGIPAHALEYIFDEFQQVDGSSRRGYGGTGLGLAIVRKLAILMGGNIRVKSQVGFGSAFTVTLPLLTEKTAVAAPQEGA